MRLLVLCSFFVSSVAFQSSVATRLLNHRRGHAVAVGALPSKEDSIVNFGDFLPWTDKEREMLKEAVQQYTVMISGKRTFILWRALVKSKSRLKDYPLDMLVSRYREEEKDDLTPFYCDLLPYLDSYKFTESGDALTGVLADNEHTTDQLHSNAMQTLADGYVGTTSTRDVQFYELGEPSIKGDKSSKNSDAGKMHEERDNGLRALLHKFTTVGNKRQASPSSKPITRCIPKAPPDDVVQIGNPHLFSEPQTVTVNINNLSTIKGKMESKVFACRDKDWQMIYDPGDSYEFAQVSIFLKCLSAPVHAKVSISDGGKFQLFKTLKGAFFFDTPSSLEGFRQIAYRKVLLDLESSDTLRIIVQLQVADY